MPIRIGETIIAQEEARLLSVPEESRSPAQLLVEARVTWVGEKELRLRLPEARVIWCGDPLTLPATQVRLPLRARQFSWRTQAFELMEAETWSGGAFYRPLKGKAVTAARANYYTRRLWQEHLASIDDAVPARPPAELVTDAALLGVRPDASREEVMAAFRSKAKAAHPDAGGDPETFKRLLKARAALLLRK